MALALPALRRSQHLILTTPQRRSSRPARPVVQAPRLSVVIVNYCLWEETNQLVQELVAAPSTQRGDIEVVIVDNHSTSHPLAKRLRRSAGVSLRRWGRNRGFARAVNEGCRLSRGQWILLLNPDITMPAGFLDGVFSLAERLPVDEPRAGIVGFQLRNSDGSRQLSSGPFPTLVQTLVRLALPRTRRKYHFVPTHRRSRVPWVTGCCLLLRRACLDQLGGLDRDFFLYYEDVDLCRRAQAQGWSVWYEPNLKAIHHHPLHLRDVPAYLRFLTRHAFLTYAAKHWPAWQFRILARIIECEARFRRHFATLHGDLAAGHHFADLRAIAADLGQGRRAAARRRLEEVVRREERRRVS